MSGGDTGAPGTGVVLLHGRGGSAQDMMGLLAQAGLSGIATAAPEAPGRTWWPTSFLAPSATMEPHVQRAVAQVEAAIASLAAQGIARDRIWLAGFSQGACLAAEAYARLGAGLAGLLAFSGGLVGTADAGGGPSEALYGYSPKRFDYSGPRDGKVWLSVHEQDPHIPLTRVRETANTFTALGARVETRIHPGQGHGLTRDDLAALAQNLGR